MIIAVVISLIIMIGFMLITEAAHLSETTLFGNTIRAIPKGYLYFAIAFFLLVEFLNYRIKKNNENKITQTKN